MAFLWRETVQVSTVKHKKNNTIPPQSFQKIVSKIGGLSKKES